MADNTSDMTTPQEPVPAPASVPITSTTPAAAPAKSNGVRTVVLAGVSAVVGAVLILGAGVIGYSIGNHDGKNHREATLTVSGERNGQPGGPQGDWQGGQQDGQQGGGPMMDGQRGIDPDGDNWSGGGQRDGQQDGPMFGGPQGQSPFGQRGDQPGGPMMQGPGSGMMGGQQGGPMMQGPGAGIQDFLNQLQSGKGLTSDQQQLLEQLKGFVGGMRNQAG